ncbi:MAG: DUF489 family protein [Pseudomonadota bacterium]|nr:DUF489 family protein [Pseudomonadota bacterium]
MILQPGTDLTLALGGLFQAGALVHELARQESYRVHALHDTAVSLLRQNVETAEEAYGGIEGVQLGLETMQSILQSKLDPSHREIFGYVNSMHKLQSRLMQSPETVEQIGQGIANISAEFSMAEDDEQHAELADLYTRTLSLLTPRIIVQGAPGKLENPLTVDRIRTALFGGVRGALLWRQLGGRRWQMVFQRRGYLQQIDELLRRLNTEPRIS